MHSYHPIRNSRNYCKELKKHYMMVIVMLQSNVTQGVNIYSHFHWIFISVCRKCSSAFLSQCMKWTGQGNLWNMNWNSLLKCPKIARVSTIEHTHTHTLSQIKRMLHLFYLKATEVRWTLRKANGFIQKTNIIYSSRYLDSFDFSWICRRVLFIKSTFV